MMQFFRRLVREQPLGTVGGIIVLLLLLCGIFADMLAPYGMNEIHLIDRYAPPSWTYPLGADQLGRDILSRIIYGARISVVVGLSATSINLVVALLIGATSGFFGGKLDMVVQRFVDAWMAFPGLLILITVMSLVGQGQLQIILVLGIAGGISGSRIARSAVIRIKENVYVQAANAIGASTGRTIFRHVLPNIMAPMIVIFTVTIGDVIIAEASLTFLGLGLPPDVASWGGDAELGRTPLHGAGAGAGAVARAVTVHRGVGHQHVRRCAPRPARPQPAGWCGSLRSSKNTKQ